MSAAGQTDDTGPEVLWTPSAARISASNMAGYQRWLEARGHRFARYDDLWRWSIDNPAEFWSSIWLYFDVQATRPYTHVVSDDPMPLTRWFSGAELNFVTQALRHRLDTSALVWESEALGAGEMSWDELRRQVAALAATLKDLGVQRGDRVVAYLPNVPQAVVAFLAVASVGAIWSLCAPEMGPAAVRDRFQQIEPKVLIACDGYRFAGKRFDRREIIRGLIEALPLESIVWVPLLDAHDPPPTVGARRQVLWHDAIARTEPLSCEPLPFDHPLWIVYSSGTTGLPKPIVHGHGGMLLSGLVSTALHSNFGPGHRVYWTVSTGWIVWNVHVMGLLTGATVYLYDGSVTGPTSEVDWSFLWKFVARHRVQTFGSGAAYFASCLKHDVMPAACGVLDHLETLCSTGSPLSPECYRWIYDRLKSDLWLAAVSGGTDIAGGFLVGSPTLPVRLGEMQCRNLGAAVYAFDENGLPVVDEVGELVCTQPMPSMPLRFWNDPGHARYHESYFDTYRTADGAPVWRHGDWLRLTPRAEALGGIIYGRSDATLNRGGIRMGTAELYRAVEAIPEVLDSLVVDLEYLGRPSCMALFVQLRTGLPFSESLEGQIRRAIRDALSPRYVPDEIHQVAAVPRNLTGKKLELPIKKLLLGQPLERVIKRDALANPDSIDWFVDFARRRSASETPR